MLRTTAGIAARVLLILGVIAVWPATWGGFTGLTVVQGQSMEPTYETGDVVVTLRQPTYQEGDVISYVVPEGQSGAGGRVIHRIVSVDDSDSEPVFTTQGDNNAQPDSWQLTASDVTGSAVMHVPGIGRMLGGETHAILIGAAAGLIVLALLWPTTPRHPTQPEPTAPPTTPHRQGRS